MAASETIKYAGLKLTIDGGAEFEKTLGQINRELKQSQAELSKVTNEYAKNEKNVQTLSAQKGHLENALRLNSDEQKNLNRILGEAREKYGENSKEVQILQTKLTEAEAKGVGFSRQLKEVTQSIEEQARVLRGQKWTEFGQQMEAAGKKMQDVGKQMGDIGKTLSMAVTAPLVGLGTAATATFTTFDDSMRQLKATLNLTGEAGEQDYKRLGDAAKEMGRATKFTAGESADALNQLALAGMSVDDALTSLPGTLNLAAAGGMGIADTANMVTDAMSIWGLETEDLTMLSNQLARANQISAQTVSQFGDGLVKAGGTAKVLVGGLTEANATLAILADNGIKASEGGTSLRNVILSLAAPTDKATSVLENLGVKAVDTNGELRPLSDIMMELNEELEGLGDAEKAAVLESIFNKADLAAVNALMGTNIKRWQELSHEIEHSGGTAEQMAKTMEEGLGGSLRTTRSAIEGLMIEIGGKLAPNIKDFAENINDLTQKFTSLDDKTQMNIIKFAAFAAAVGPVLVVGGKLVTVVGTITSGIGAMTKAVGAAGSAKAALAAKFPLVTTALTKLQTGYALVTTGMSAFALKVPILSTGITALQGTMSAASVKLTAFAAAQTAAGASSGVLTGGLTAVSAGFAKLTAAMLANPIGLIVAGVAALAAGIAFLVIQANKVSEEYKAMGEESARLTERQDELAAAAANAAAQFANNIQEMNIAQARTKDLADSIEDLASRQNLSAGEMEMLDGYIKELNDSIPGLTLAYDEQAGALNMTAEAMNAYIAVAEKERELNAQREESARLFKEREALERELIETAQRRAEMEEQLASGEVNRRADKKALQAAINELITTEEGYNVALEANAELYDSMTGLIEENSHALADLKLAQEQTAQTTEELTEVMEQQKYTAEELEKAHKEAFDKMNSSLEGYQRVASNAFGTVKEAAALSVRDLTSNLEENARAVEEWSKNIAILAERGVDEGLIAQLRKGGVEAAATVRELVKASDEELGALNGAFEDSTRVAVESMKRELDPEGVAQTAGELLENIANAILENPSMEDALIAQVNAAYGSMGETIGSIGFDGLGDDTIVGYLNGIDSRMKDVETAGTDTATAYMGGITDAFDMHSPSRKMQEIGVNAGEGLILGTEDMRPKVIDTATALAKAFIGAISDEINQNQDINNATRKQVEDMKLTADMAVQNAYFPNVGYEMATGVAQGMQNGSSVVSNAATILVNNALAAMRAAAEIRSPSRKTMEIFKQVGEGAIVGLTAKGEELVEVCKSLTGDVVDSFHIDPAELVEGSKEALQSLKSALPTMQNQVKQATSPQATASPPTSISVDMTGGHYYIREEADILKIARAVKKELLRETDYASRIGGLALQL